MMEMEK